MSHSWEKCLADRRTDDRRTDRRTDRQTDNSDFIGPSVDGVWACDEIVENKARIWDNIMKHAMWGKGLAKSAGHAKYLSLWWWDNQVGG